MIEGNLSYIPDSWRKDESILSMHEEYGSDFTWMMGLIYCLSDMRGLYACARTFKSYEKNDLPGMTAKEMNICDEYEDGETWCTHPVFEGICICHAIYNLTDINLFSYLDVLRMNDFWCEVKVTHQPLTDLKGRRYCILNKKKWMIIEPSQIKYEIAWVVSDKSYIQLSMQDFADTCPNPTWGNPCLYAKHRCLNRGSEDISRTGIGRQERVEWYHSINTSFLPDDGRSLTDR